MALRSLRNWVYDVPLWAVAHGQQRLGQPSGQLGGSVFQVRVCLYMCRCSNACVWHDSMCDILPLVFIFSDIGKALYGEYMPFTGLTRIASMQPSYMKRTSSSLSRTMSVGSIPSSFLQRGGRSSSVCSSDIDEVRVVCTSLPCRPPVTVCGLRVRPVRRTFGGSDQHPG